MNGFALDQLAKYNSEKARGIMHTPEWKELMAVYQELFNAEQAQEMERRGMRYA